MRKFPARLHVLLPRDSPFGVVIRRGPSNNVCTVGWDRATDTFSLGQWLRGRIYERRSDLSPDGKFLIYFAMDGKWGSESGGSWTAISLAPYLKPLRFWPKGNCWDGGGLFTSDKTYWLNGYGTVDTKGIATSLKRDRAFRPAESLGHECRRVYYPRLLRDGWTLKNTKVLNKREIIDLFEKPVGTALVLRKLAHRTLNPLKGKGCYYDEHQLQDTEAGETLDLPDWEWAEVSGERLVWAEGGCLYSSPVDQRTRLCPQLLRDFNGMVFERLEAPY